MGNPAVSFTPRRHDYYERQWRLQRGAWAGPDTERHLDEDVALVVDAFRTRGTRAGLAEADRRGLGDGARLYVAIRAETEEPLAARLAALRANLVRKPNPLDAIRMRFVQARLDEVQGAVQKGITPPQAVVDKPEIPRRHVPRWIPFVALGLSVIALLRSR